MNNDKELLTPGLAAFGQRRAEPIIWNGGEGTGDEIGFIGPSLGRCTSRLIDPNKLRGKVLMFDDSRGFGFIYSDEEPKLFVHIKQCIDVETLKKGQRVAYEIGEDRNGKRCAVNVETIN